MYKDNFSIIIPAHNEQATIRNCCLQFGAHQRVSNVIVVANDCSDMTCQEATEGNAIVVETPQKGKGFAIKSGLKLATEEFVILLDGDIKNPSPEFTDRLIKGQTTNKECLVKGAFDRSKQPGPVTDILVKPVLEIANHPAKVISQPLSGLVAVRKSFFENLDLPNDFGIDLAILLAAYQKGLPVKEVFLPTIEHRERPWSHYKFMALEVAKVFKNFQLISANKEW